MNWRFQPEVPNFGLFISTKKADNIDMASVYRVHPWREEHAPDTAKLRDLLIAEGYSVYQWSDRPGAVYGSHMHDTEQSHWVISGSLELVVENAGSFVLNAGDRDFMPAGTYHTARVIGDNSVVYLVGERAAEDRVLHRRTEVGRVII